MAVSDRPRRWYERQTLLVRGTSRYDLYLIAIPIFFLVAITLSRWTTFSVHQSMFGASLLGAAVMVDGLFRNPPEVDKSRRRG